MSNNDHLWNDLPAEERKRLMPHMIETQIKNIESCKEKAKRAHRQHMAELNGHIGNLERELGRYEN